MKPTLWCDNRVGGHPRFIISSEMPSEMRVPDEVLKCVVFLSCKSNPDQEPSKAGGTAFVAGWQLPGLEKGIGTYYLMTAKHCIESIVKEGDARIYFE